jgi:hypothetical protein
MVASRQNFFKAHWDWLVALAGLVALGLAVAYLFSSIGQSPDEAASACSDWLNGELKKPHKGVDAVDLKDLAKVAAQLKAPPALREIDAKKRSFLASEQRVFCQKGDEASKEKACGRPIPADLEVCPFCGVKQHLVKVAVGVHLIIVCHLAEFLPLWHFVSHLVTLRTHAPEGGVVVIHLLTILKVFLSSYGMFGTHNSEAKISTMWIVLMGRCSRLMMPSMCMRQELSAPVIYSAPVSR